MASIQRAETVGDTLIDWTARVAVGCFLVRLLLLGRPRRGVAAGRLEVGIWTAGWLLLAAHTACAFHFRHHWSHAAACNHTARRTLEAVGWDWGGGVWFNYLTLAVWGADVVMLWKSRLGGVPTPRWWTRLAVGWIGFMVLNATVVFGARWWWIVGIGFVIGACGAGVSARRSS